MAGEVYENLKRMNELNDSIHEAERNVSISFEDYCSDLAEPQKPEKKGYPALKKHVLKEIYEEKAPETSKKFLVGLIVGPAILGAAALPSFISAFGGGSSAMFVINLMTALIATGGGLFLLFWGLANKRKADKARADAERGLAEAQERLNRMNAEEEAKCAAEIKDIDEEYEKGFAKYQSELREYKKTLSQKKTDYNDFVAKNNSLISSSRAEYEKIGEECFPSYYQGFEDLPTLMGLASAHPLYDIEAIMDCYKRKGNK